MNKKDLNELLQDDCDYYLTEAEFNKVWNWIEQYAKEQRIDERQSIIKLIKRIKADKPSIGAKEALRTVLIELGEE